MDETPEIIYFSSVTENTMHFVNKLPFHAKRLPLKASDEAIVVEKPFALFVPTYGAGKGKAAVPKQVIKFLSDPEVREFCVGVVGGGNINFGDKYAAAADILSEKLHVPVLYRFELRGGQADVDNVTKGLRENWSKLLELKGLLPVS